MSKEIRAAVTTEPYKIIMKNLPYPETLEEGDFMAKLRMCGVCGTDHHIWSGDYPNTPWPIIQGHEVVAEVFEISEETGASIEVNRENLVEGDRVIWGGATPCGECWYCRWLPQNYRGSLCTGGSAFQLDGNTYLWGGFSDYIYAKNKVPIKIPEDVPDKVAVFTDTLASVWGIERALSGTPAAGEGLFWGQSAVVQGSGPIGIAAAMKLKEYNVENLIMIGGPDKRLEEAEKFGVDYTINIEEITDPKERLSIVQKLTGGRGADLVFEGAGVPAAFAEAIDLVRRGGIVVEVGHYTDAGTVEVNPYTICYKDLTLICQYGFSFHQYEVALRQLIKWYRNDTFPLEDLITHEYKIDNVEEGLKLHKKWETMKVIATP
jgi:L-iditol 2-dehydrogenase